ncbi:hypothetical protein XA68_11135 [Ophiocordyceps unilateralis]|uniref:Uncharacterized protein n=1 Tax=Ophiocordyceps unilateralis TaxID=268505 RepID=A0A2A9PGI3_OPHUN|nr:hypothetical protein XA68_11135 [Ophiocordyceps unilateralis]
MSKAREEYVDLLRSLVPSFVLVAITSCWALETDLRRRTFWIQIIPLWQVLQSSLENEVMPDGLTEVQVGIFVKALDLLEGLVDASSVDCVNFKSSAETDAIKPCCSSILATNDLPLSRIIVNAEMSSRPSYPGVRCGARGYNHHFQNTCGCHLCQVGPACLLGVIGGGYRKSAKISAVPSAVSGFPQGFTEWHEMCLSGQARFDPVSAVGSRGANESSRYRGLHCQLR